MSKPKLFISHSSKDNALARALQEKLAPKFEVLIDLEEIRGGDLWREKIDGMLLDCDCAVILMTPAAKDESQWVPAEAAMLRFRRQVLEPGGPFKVIALTVDGFPLDDLSAPPFGPAELDANQAVPLDSAVVEVQGILDGLREILEEHEARTGLRDLELYVSKKLRTAELETREAVGTVLGFDDAKARLVAGRPRWLAAKLLRSNLPAFVQAVRKVRAFEGREVALEMLENTAPFLWITPEGPRRLAELVLGPERPKRSVGLVSVHSTTPHCYVQCACAKLPAWRIWTVKDDFAPPVFDHLVEELLAQAREALMLEPDEEPSDEELAQELEDDMETFDPIVVLLHGFGRQDADLLERLADKFKPLTFLVSTDAAEPPLTRRFPNLVLLPALDPSVETQAIRLVQKTRNLLTS